MTPKVATIAEEGKAGTKRLDYRPIEGAPDEMLGADGTVRPVWRNFVNRLSQMDETELDTRFAKADRYLRDAGVFYRSYGGGPNVERSWPLSHIPVLVDALEWERLAEGLTQRAELLEQIIADIYSDNRLIREGFLPPSLVAANPEYLRPVAGLKPAGDHFLYFVAFEMGRGPDGNWWVLADRTQAPSGAGFALENRVATTRAFSDIYADTHVHRLASFFGSFRETLQSYKRNTDDRIAVLTPGPANETYFEHAYIARYLGFMLLEGEDLAVVDNRVMVRTVAGLKPISVLWRRLDANYADPLELNQASQIGTPGLVEALRNQSVTIVNALGTGLLETRAFLAFMPAICRRLLNEDLKLPSIATWWCGQKAEREHVIRNIDRMVLGSSFSRIPFFDDGSASVAGTATPEKRAELVRNLMSDGPSFVGQEIVKLSTTPAYVDGAFAPRPMSLRVFAARTKDGWSILPGGFARIGASNDVSAIAMQKGGSVADVWIVSDRPVKWSTLLPSEENFTRNMPGSLPSRAADNLFWLGRYIERAEGALRILRAWHGRFAEYADRSQPLLANVSEYLAALEIDTREAVPENLVMNISSALYSASNVRDRFSPDGWLALNDLSKTAQEFREKVQPGDDATRAMTVLLRKLAGFAGLVHENMYRFTGWRFLSIGRYIERGLHMSRLLGHLSGPDAPDGALDMLIEIGDSVMTHRRRYNVATARLTVTDLLALDPLNPRSILYQLNEIKTEVEQLPNAIVNGQMSAVHRASLRLYSRLALMTPENLGLPVYHQLEEEMENFSDLLTRTYIG